VRLPDGVTVAVAVTVAVTDIVGLAVAASSARLRPV
jgi:hypothetical protein